jgi:hypothetical protein
MLVFGARVGAKVGDSVGIGDGLGEEVGTADGTSDSVGACVARTTQDSVLPLESWPAGHNSQLVPL